MTESEVVEQLVEFTNILLAGASVLFTVVSAYIAALNYFIGSANFLARFFSFLFVSLILGFLMSVLAGAQATQIGLVNRLHELDDAGELTAPGKAIIANATSDPLLAQLLGMSLSIDDVVRYASWIAMGVILVVLFFLTFIHRWKPDIIPVRINNPAESSS